MIPDSSLDACGCSPWCSDCLDVPWDGPTPPRASLPCSSFPFFFFFLFKANGSALELVDSHLENVSDSEEFLLYEIVLLCLDGLCSLLVEK